MRTISCFILIIMAVALSACGERETTEKAALQSVEIRDVLQLDESSTETSDSDEFLGTPYLTVTDAQGKIYTQDASLEKIFVFNEVGEFQDVFGGKGRGPGEFESIYTMTMLEDSRLMTYDYMAKRATIFNEDLEVEKTLDMNFKSAISDITPLSENEILLSNFGEGHLLQIYNLDDEGITGQMFPIDEFLKSDDASERVMFEQTDVFTAKISNNLIALTPQNYSGEIYVYERTGSEWVQKNVLEGYEDIQKSFTVHETTSEPHEKAWLISAKPEGGYYGFEYHSISLGLYNLADNKLAHISYRDANSEKTELKFIYEVFDTKSGRLEKAGEIDSLKTTYPPERMPVYIDKEGFLYVVDITKGFILRKIEVLW